MEAVIASNLDELNLSRNMDSTKVWDNEVAKTIAELEELRKDPIFKKETELVQTLERLARTSHTSALEAKNFLDNEVGKKNRSIAELGLSAKVYNCLMRYAIYTIDDVISFPRNQWSKLKLLGQYSCEEIQEKVRVAGYPDFTII